MRCPKIILLALFVLFGISAVAQDINSDPNQLLAVEDYLRIAAKNNAGLKAAFAQWRMAMMNIPQAKALDDPRFTYGYFIEEVETRTGPQKQRFSISQKFPWFGKIQARTDAAAASAKAAYHQYQAEKLKLFEKVKHAVYEYAYLHEAIGIAEQNLELLKHFEQVAQARYRTAASTHPDIIRAQIELALLEDHLTGLRNMQMPMVSGLNAILNRESQEPLAWPKNEAAFMALDSEQVFVLIEKKNPELVALKKEINAARHQIELAQKRYYPDVSLGLDWIQTDSARGSNVWGSGRDPIVAMISVNIPLWTDSYKAGENQARAKMRKARSQHMQTEYDLAARAASVLYNVEETHRKAALYENTLIPRAKEMLGVSESAYRNGSIDFLNLVDAQRKLLTFELTWQRILTDHLKGLAQVEVLTGGTLPESVKTD